MKKRMVAKIRVYVISITLIILSCVFFNDSIVLDASSAEPAIIIAVLIAQGYILRKDEFANQATKKPEHLSPEENRLMCKCISEASVYMIPINLFLIFFLKRVSGSILIRYVTPAITKIYNAMLIVLFPPFLLYNKKLI